MLKRFRNKRKGMTLIETIICIVIFCVVVITVLSAMEIVRGSYSNEVKGMTVKENYMMISDLLKNDVKSSCDITTSRNDSDITLENGTIIDYSIINSNKCSLYRNDELLTDKLKEAYFTNIDNNSLKLYISYGNNQEYEIFVCK